MPRNISLVLSRSKVFPPREPALWSCVRSCCVLRSSGGRRFGDKTQATFLSYAESSARTGDAKSSRKCRMTEHTNKRAHDTVPAGSCKDVRNMPKQVFLLGRLCCEADQAITAHCLRYSRCVYRLQSSSIPDHVNQTSFSSSTKVPLAASTSRTSTYRQRTQCCLLDL